MSPPPLEGAIELRLRLADGRVGAVEVRNSRPFHAGRALAGRTAKDALALLPTAFSLCGTAHLLAGLQACEGATGVVAAAPHQAARKFLLAGETTLEHGQRVLRDWPHFLGEPADLAAVKELRSALSGLLGLVYPHRDWMTPGGGRMAPETDKLSRRLGRAAALILRHVFARPAVEAIGSAAAFAEWAERGGTGAARLIARVLETRSSGYGAGPSGLLTDVDAVFLVDRFKVEDLDFISRPHLRGRVPETGPLARQAGHPLVATLLDVHGNGVLARLAARLVEMASALGDLQALLPSLENSGGAGGAAQSGEGIGMVEAARGLLVHHAELTAGRIAAYRILSPTEWNFHPTGPLVRGLEGAEAGPELEWRAGLLVTAIDPCVSCAIAIENDG